jgi:hypothetical protein
MAVVDDLVTREASGVLEVAGNPSGAIYLDGGRVAYARASWVPGLAIRLRAIVPSLTGTREPRLGEDAADAAVAALAVRHGYLTTDELHELIRSVIVEAFLVLTIPLAADSPVSTVRFTPAPVSWTDLFPRLGIGAVRGEAVSRAERMTACGLAPTTAVAPRDLASPSAVLTAEQWAVACQIGDRVSARELAMRRGASLSDTVHCLGSLVRAGLCVPVQPARRGRHPYAPVPSARPPATQPLEPSSGPQPLVPSCGPQPEVPSFGPQPLAPSSGPQPLAPSSGPQPLAPSSGPQPEVPSFGPPPSSGTHPLAPPRDTQPELPFAASPAVTSPGFPATERLQVRPAPTPRWRPVPPARPPSVEVLRQVLDGLRKL